MSLFAARGLNEARERERGARRRMRLARLSVHFLSYSELSYLHLTPVPANLTAVSREDAGVYVLGLGLGGESR